jgi:hypothetical protein
MMRRTLSIELRVERIALASVDRYVSPRREARQLGSRVRLGVRAHSGHRLRLELVEELVVPEDREHEPPGVGELFGADVEEGVYLGQVLERQREERARRFHERYDPRRVRVGQKLGDGAVEEASAVVRCADRDDRFHQIARSFGVGRPAASPIGRRRHEELRVDSAGAVTDEEEALRAPSTKLLEESIERLDAGAERAGGHRRRGHDGHFAAPSFAKERGQRGGDAIGEVRKTTEHAEPEKAGYEDDHVVVHAQYGVHAGRSFGQGRGPL